MRRGRVEFVVVGHAVEHGHDRIARHTVARVERARQDADGVEQVHGVGPRRLDHAQHHTGPQQRLDAPLRAQRGRQIADDGRIGRMVVAGGVDQRRDLARRGLALRLVGGLRDQGGDREIRVSASVIRRDPLQALDQIGGRNRGVIRRCRWATGSRRGRTSS